MPFFAGFPAIAAKTDSGLNPFSGEYTTWERPEPDGFHVVLSPGYGHESKHDTKG
jgi:hypothetical protein